MIFLSSFEQFDVVMPKKRLTSFGLAVTQERWEVFLGLVRALEGRIFNALFRGPYHNDVGNFLECSFTDKVSLLF